MHANYYPRARSLRFVWVGGGEAWDTTAIKCGISVVSLYQQVAGNEGNPPTFPCLVDFSLSPRKGWTLPWGPPRCQRGRRPTRFGCRTRGAVGSTTSSSLSGRRLVPPVEPTKVGFTKILPNARKFPKTSWTGDLVPNFFCVLMEDRGGGVEPQTYTIELLSWKTFPDGLPERRSLHSCPFSSGTNSPQS